MTKFEVGDLTVELNDNSVVITDKWASDMDEMLTSVNDYINSHPEIQNLLKEKYPKDWEFVMVHEGYGFFLLDGSPQIGESDWKMVYKRSIECTIVEFHGLS